MFECFKLKRKQLRKKYKQKVCAKQNELKWTYTTVFRITENVHKKICTIKKNFKEKPQQKKKLQVFLLTAST